MGTKLNAELIMGEAIKMLSEVGLAGVSLRKLAKRLHVTAPALARHVGDKDDLLVLMSSHLFHETIAAIPKCRNWSDWMRAFGNVLWAMHRSTRDSAKLFVLAPPRKDLWVRSLSEVVSNFAQTGVDPAVGLRIQANVQALISGWSIQLQEDHRTIIEEQLSIDTAFAEGLEAMIAGFARTVE